MDDDRVWSFEKSLWDGTPEHYRELVDETCLMVLPHPPFVLSGTQAIEAVADTTRWTEVAFSKGQIARPQEGLIVVAYHIEASRGDETYQANRTSTYRWLSHEVWRVIQHQQTPPLVVQGAVEKTG
ncbi:DUF4440 domain-containing protein [Methylobacterium sp. WL8]|uniref:DUF4440 domain-containing protein n=1 Tax=Methylobacterium sp. WL8 TaxID=2603899 RepID=UPI0011CBA00D|nr:DUF4440 domain-containing protein [Methylobacterium sp. WL8]TXN83098.1 DUF4440 domain-containing protein [Methylobacterium sp. WL8]